jgi:hypothetical protein
LFNRQGIQRSKKKDSRTDKSNDKGPKKQSAPQGR